MGAAYYGDGAAALTPKQDVCKTGAKPRPPRYSRNLTRRRGRTGGGSDEDWAVI